MIFDDNCPLMMEREAGLPDAASPLQVGFYNRPTPDKNKTKEAGYPVFRDKEYCIKIVPGDEKAIFDQPSTPDDRKKFPNAYQAFKNRESTPAVEGMPIDQWPQLTRAEAMTMRAAAIYSVEALAAVNDANITKLGHQGREWRTKAQAFLATAKDSAAAHKLAAENQALKDQMAAMQAQINALGKAKKQKAA